MKLWYYCSNNGDGSVSVHFCNSPIQADELDEAQEDGWGESSVGCVNLSIEDGKLFREELVYTAGIGCVNHKIEVV